MILRAKTKELFHYENLTEVQQKNSELNLKEMNQGETILQSLPRRIVFELTNACNLNCVMCGRNDAEFKPTFFNTEWLEKFNDIFYKAEEVSLFGWGEPTVHPKFVNILKYLNNFPVKKYFCTNGMRLNKIKNDIFENNVDIIAISVDGACAKTNNKIRRGSDFDLIVKTLSDIETQKLRCNHGPYMNFVFCAMKSNLNELPELVKIASNIGLEEVKVVYLTVFDKSLLDESLWNCSEEVEEVFNATTQLADELGVKLKLPYIQGHDPAEGKLHKDCFVPWRDFFLGSDGYIRPCMSTPLKFIRIDDYKNAADMWNCEEYQKFRKIANDTNLMDKACKRCYQSSHCNWNNRQSFIQIENEFAPKWNK